MCIRDREYYQNSSVLDCVTQNVHNLQHTYMSSSYRSNRLGLSHWDPHVVCRGGCLELYYCKMVEWFWWNSSLISTTNWFPSVLWHCWFGHLACKNRPQKDLLCVKLDVKPYTLTHSGRGLSETALDWHLEWLSAKHCGRRCWWMAQDFRPVWMKKDDLNTCCNILG